MTITLRDYQQDAEDIVRESMMTNSAVLLVLSTGAGKTVIFSDIAKRAAAKGNRVLILAHRDTLIRQASNKLTEYGVEHGIIMAGCTPNPRLRVQVASVQTMVRRIKKHDYHFDLIIIDEAHLSAAKSYGDVVDAIRTVRPGARVLGVTGSPCRLDNKGLGVGFGGMFEHMVVGISIKDLIDRKFLVRPVVYASPTQLDLSSVRTTAGDFNTHDLSDLIDKPQLVGDAVNHYRKICPDVPAVAWCVTVGHARHVADQFNAAGIAAVALSGDDDTGARERALRGLARGTIKVITFCQLLVEGVDCPAIGAIIILRPTKSLASYLQVIGRGLRPHGSKDRCYVLDHAGCTFYHGFADDIRDWSLEGAPKRKKKKKDDEDEVTVVQCPACYACHEPAPTCPACGHVYAVAKQRNVEHVDGDLQEITPEMREAMSRQRRQEQGRAQTVEELIALGHHPKAAEKIVQARAAKQELISALIADMTAWSESTNQYPLPTFGVSFRDIRYMKPKALKDLRARFDAHKAAYLAGDENARIIQSELL